MKISKVKDKCFKSLNPNYCIYNNNTKFTFYRLTIKNSLKVTKKPKRCSIIPHLIDFYSELMKKQIEPVKTLLKSNLYGNIPEFIVKMQNVNDTLFKNEELEVFLSDKLDNIENVAKNKNYMLNFLEVNYKVFISDKRCTKLNDIISKLKEKYYLFSQEEKR